jgi:hypothetical protein
MPNELWETIIRNISNNPRDIRTIPLNGGGRWFHVSINRDGVTILIDNAKMEKPSSKLSQIRVLDKDDFRKMYSIYLRRKAGEKVSHEATQTGRNQVYIYSIFHYCGGI